MSRPTRVMIICPIHNKERAPKAAITKWLDGHTVIGLCPDCIAFAKELHKKEGDSLINSLKEPEGLQPGPVAPSDTPG